MQSDGNVTLQSVQTAPVGVKSDMEEYRGALTDTLKINARLQCDVVEKIDELQQLIGSESDSRKAHSGDVIDRLEQLMQQLAETNRLQQETLTVLSQHAEKQQVEIREMKEKLDDNYVAGLQQTMDDRFNELFTRLALGDMERRRQSSEMINELKYFPQKYCEDLRKTNVRLEEQLLEMNQENRKLTDQIVVLSGKLQTEGSQFTVDNANQSTAQHAIPASHQENVAIDLQSLVKIVAERNSHEDMLKQMLIDSRHEVENLKRKVDEKTEELREYQLVAETTRRRQLQEGINDDSGNSWVKHDSAEHDEAPKPEHVSRLQNVYSEVTSLLDARGAASWMFQRLGLTVRELEEIQASQMTIGAETLLNILLKAPRELFDCFLKALRATDQQHVYLRILCPDATWTSEHFEMIRTHYILLLDKLDTKYSTLTVRLYDDKVLSLREKEDIEAELTSTRQNEKLLSVLSRKSAEQWELFLTALDNSGQSHIRRLVTGQTDAGDDEATRWLNVVEQKVDTEIKLKLQVEQLNKELIETKNRLSAEITKFEETQRQYIAAEQESLAEKNKTSTRPLLLRRPELRDRFNEEDGEKLTDYAAGLLDLKTLRTLKKLKRHRHRAFSI